MAGRELRLVMHLSMSASGKMSLLGVNSKHLNSGDVQPIFSHRRPVIYSMRYCPFAQRAMLVAIAKDIK